MAAIATLNGADFEAGPYYDVQHPDLPAISPPDRTGNMRVHVVWYGHHSDLFFGEAGRAESWFRLCPAQ